MPGRWQRSDGSSAAGTKGPRRARSSSFLKMNQACLQPGAIVGEQALFIRLQQRGRRKHMNQIAIELDRARRTTLKSSISGNLQQTRARRFLDTANGIHQNADRSERSAQHNHRRMEARLLLPKIEEPVETEDRNRGPS